jgi:hypothetical protein
MELAGSELSLSPDGNTNISCNGGNDGFIKLNITGGSGDYTSSWSGPDGPLTTTASEIFGLKAGAYADTVKDMNGCKLTPLPSFTLTEPTALAIASTTSTYNGGLYEINCNGGTGSIDITVTGGSSVGTYYYTWSTTDGSGLVNGQEDQFALTAGIYHLKVTDSNNCEKTIDITLRQPPTIGINLSATHITI